MLGLSDAGGPRDEHSPQREAGGPLRPESSAGGVSERIEEEAGEGASPMSEGGVNGGQPFSMVALEAESMLTEEV